MKIRVKGDKQTWWICDNDLCKNRLAKLVVGKDFEHKRVEILGAHGEEFSVRHPGYIKVYCAKCGEPNSIVGGKIGTKLWNKNIRDHVQEEEDESFIFDDFFDNAYKRRLLLEKLTPRQKNIFRYLQKNKMAEDKEVMASLDILDRKDYVSEMLRMLEKQQLISMDLMKRRLVQEREDIQRIKNNLQKSS